MAPGMRVSDESYEVTLSWGDRPIDVRLLPTSPAPSWMALSQDARAAFAHPGQRPIPLVIDAAGELRVTHPLAQTTVQLTSEEPVRLQSGAFTLTVRRSTRPALPARSFWKERDFSFFKLATVTGMCSAALLVTLLISPQVDAAQDPFFRKVAETVEAAIPKPPVIPVIKPPDEVPKGPTEPSPSTDHRVARTKRPTSAPVNPLRAGILGIASASDSFNQLLQGGSGFNDAMAASDNLQGGPAVADSGGIAGIRGGGPGGPGTGGPFGIGDIGIQRPGGGDGGPFAIGGGRREPVKPAGPPKVVGGLDRIDIQRVINQHKAAIRACYETGLSRSPDLEGKVAVTFTIDPSGFVRSAQVAESSLDSALVEDCILQRIGVWTFPQPRGGGVVEVNFPWLFRPAGGV